MCDFGGIFGLITFCVRLGVAQRQRYAASRSGPQNRERVESHAAPAMAWQRPRDSRPSTRQRRATLAALVTAAEAGTCSPG